MSNVSITPADIHRLSPTQLDTIEVRAIERYQRMQSLTPNVADVARSVAALAIEIIEAVQSDTTTMVYVLAVDDLRMIVRAYLCRWKLSSYPYRNGQLMDYISYADFTTIGACIG